MSHGVNGFRKTVKKTIITLKANEKQHAEELEERGQKREKD